jgi:hypothetical protein
VRRLALKVFIAVLSLTTVEARADERQDPAIKQWATAVSKNDKAGTAVIFRFAKEFTKNFRRASQPQRVVIQWPYTGEKGMPARSEVEVMSQLEDALSPYMTSDGFATLAVVSTGNNLREWIYYAKSETEFLERMNKALAGMPHFPIQVVAAADPKWTSYEALKSSAREKKP